jgi:signal transduction histidine kinase
VSESGERISFPDGPRSEFERSIGELVDRAEKVLSTQGRLRSLLQANRIVVEELELSQVLRRIAEAAVSLVNAQYGALGVIAPDGRLEQFIHVGMPQSDADRIGHLPEGRGLLGAVIDERHSIRLAQLHDDPRSAGFPAHHPQMEGFLGVPIRVREEVYGNLYLTNPAAGEFSLEDEELVTALAATAGIAIDNARLFDESRRRQRWSAALAEVTSALLSGASDDVLGVVADRVASVIDADLVCVVIPVDDETLLIDTARGEGSAELVARRYPAAGSLVAEALESGRVAVSVEPRSSMPGSPEVVIGDEPVRGPTVAIPLLAFERPLGALTISRAEGGAGFTPAELEMAADFARQASVAVELARGRADRQRLELVEDRNRIARDLHDHVIQRLFGSGMTLQAIASTAPEATRAAIAEQVEAIDTAISEIRTAVFTLTSRSSGAPALRHRVLDVVAESSASLASAPRLTFSGPVDLLIDGELADDVVAVVREALANVARHASARSADVAIVVDDAGVTVTIDDDGRGMSNASRRSSGTANLRARAVRHGGDFELRGRESGGTRLRWTALLAPTEEMS